MTDCSTGFLHLDYDNVVNLWGEGGDVFTSSSADDELMLDAEEDFIEEAAAFLFQSEHEDHEQHLFKPLSQATQQPQQQPEALMQRESKKLEMGVAFMGSCSWEENSSDNSLVVPDTACSNAASTSNPHGLVPNSLIQQSRSGSFVYPMSSLPTVALPSAKQQQQRQESASPPTTCFPGSQAMVLQTPILSESARQRAESLQRYREKKARRMFTKMVRYKLRKINADKRPRIKGRFIKKGEQAAAADSDSVADVETEATAS